MVYVDSCIPMYLVGSDHPNKQRVIEVVSQLVHGREELVTSAEAFQEIIHRYKAIKDSEHLKIAYDALEAMVTKIVDVTKEDTDRARTLAIEYKELSSRDCLHVAIMNRSGCKRVWTFDKAFTVVSNITTIG